MRVLYLNVPGMLQPWYDDFRSAVGAVHTVCLYDPEKPTAGQFEDVEVVVDQGGSVGTRALIDAALAARVKLWQVLGTGVDHVDVAYFLEKGLMLANTPGPFSAVALAEHAMFLMLYFAKQFDEHVRNLRSKVFYFPVSEELSGKTLALVGLGASGQALAARAKAMGMRIAAVDAVDIPGERLDELGVEVFAAPSELEEVLAQADYVSLHVPLTSKTRHMIDSRALAAMKPTAVLINVARGEIADEDALVEALRSGRIRGAGLDVYAEEPLPAGHPFLKLPNVVATPHTAGQTYGTSRRRGEACAENVDRIARGLEPLYRITEAG